MHPAATQPFEIHRESAGPFAGILTVRLEQPGKPVVVLDLELIQRLEATLRALPAAAPGFVLASASERVFVAGADLKAISELDDGQLHRYLEYAARVFGMIADLPYPTVAAINGAALGGGLELAMHCDALVASPGAKPYPVGLPEAGLSICPGWGGTNLLPARIDSAEAIRRTASGQTMLFEDAVAAGMFDGVARDGELLTTAKQLLLESRKPARAPGGAPSRWIGSKNPGAVIKALDAVRHELPGTESALAVVKAIDAGLTRGWKAACEVERNELVRLRHTAPAKAALEAFFAKSRK